MRIVLLILVCLPLLEIAVLVLVGSHIGILATIGLIIFSGLLGSYLLRSQGLSALARMREEIEKGRVPDKHLADAAMIILAGLMLIIPGFVSDGIGILLFIPFVRQWFQKLLTGRVTAARTRNRFHDTVIELDESEYQRTDERSEDHRNLPPHSPVNKN